MSDESLFEKGQRLRHLSVDELTKIINASDDMKPIYARAAFNRNATNFHRSWNSDPIIGYSELIKRKDYAAWVAGDRGKHICLRILHQFLMSMFKDDDSTMLYERFEDEGTDVLLRILKE